MKKMLPLFLVFSLSGSGCAGWLETHPRVQGVLDCTGPAIVEAIPSVMASVIAALLGQNPDWGELGKLEAVHGLELIKCAVMSLMGQAQPFAARSASAMNVMKNGAEYLKARQK